MPRRQCTFLVARRHSIRERIQASGEWQLLILKAGHSRLVLSIIILVYLQYSRPRYKQNIWGEKWMSWLTTLQAYARRQPVPAQRAALFHSDLSGASSIYRNDRHANNIKVQPEKVSRPQDLPLLLTLRF